GARSSGSEASRPQRRDASGVGRLRQPSSLGFSQVTELVKDIPAWIKLALAGLASLVLLLGAYTILAAARTRRLERQRAKLMEDIGLLQAALLPAVPGRLGALLTTVAYRPADGPAAGGDFYDAFAMSDGRVGLLLGDISGHGRQALAKTTLVRFTVRAHLEAGMSPREALTISGRSLDGRLADDFSTVIAAVHDPVKGTLTYASAGHPPPLIVGPQAHEPVTASSAPPIGAGFPTGQRQTVLPMPEGTTVCIYSDGLLEARVASDELGRERLGTWLKELGPEATAKALLDLVVQRADRVPDDLAACVLHASAGATAPAARVEQLKLDVLDVEGPELEGFLKACGVGHADRAIAGRRVAEQLAISGGVVVEVRTGEHPMVSVSSIGDHAEAGARPASRAR
ncbi:MAG: serine/threonine-protein phosphatase, partial [Actinomycetota bacterium]|nr:serine/threonine-protein phosphatase [Actinomycetota bacterium]